MINYFKLDVIPIILNRFKVDDIVICKLSNQNIANQILKYCEDNNSIYIAIDSKDTFKQNTIDKSTSNILADLKDYGAIFLESDPNWYTIYNELNIIKQNNTEFPLVFICNNIFPYKRRDAYINPENIPKEFRKECVYGLSYDNFVIKDGLYHANEENNEKNGVLTAIEDFLSENDSIGIIDFQLIDGVSILYPINSISYIRLNRLLEEIEEYSIEYNDVLDNIVENQFLTDYISKENIFDKDLNLINQYKMELIEKEKLINDFEDKIKLHNTELSYKNSKINRFDSKLSLKDSQIKNIESKLINRENEIDALNDELQITSNQINFLKDELDKKEQLSKKERIEFEEQISKANLQISYLKRDISQKNQQESELVEKIQILNNQIDENMEQLNKKDNIIVDKDNIILEKNNVIINKEGIITDKDNVILDKDNQITVKQDELNDLELTLDSIKHQLNYNLSKLDNNKYCISCYKEEISNNREEIKYLNKNILIKKILHPLSYIYLFIKSKPSDLFLNFKLYNALKNSNCFDIGFYLNNNPDVRDSRWCKYFSPELHYVCNGFNEKRKFNKKYFNRNSKIELLNYIKNCP